MAYITQGVQTVQRVLPPSVTHTHTLSHCLLAGWRTAGSYLVGASLRMGWKGRTPQTAGRIMPQIADRSVPSVLTPGPFYLPPAVSAYLRPAHRLSISRRRYNDLVSNPDAAPASSSKTRQGMVPPTRLLHTGYDQGYPGPDLPALQRREEPRMALPTTTTSSGRKVTSRWASEEYSSERKAPCPICNRMVPPTNGCVVTECGSVHWWCAAGDDLQHG